MIITENTNLKVTLQITDADSNIKPVIIINSNLAKGGNNLNFNLTVIDTATVETNLEAVQIEMDNFKIALNEKMLELGYKITI